MQQDEALLPKMRATLNRYHLLSSGQTVVIGVSGGQDSTALAHALATCREELNLQLIAAHFNHGFRGEEAKEDVRFVANLAESLQLPFVTASEDIPALRRRLHLSAQEAARQRRHAFLRSVAEAHGAEAIALAHTRDDRVETILFNILRGSGIEGLSGFAPASPPIIRPLYDVTRAETEAYCNLHNLQPRTDSSNANLTYRRNRTRKELLPYLRTYYNTRVDDALVRLADISQDENELLHQFAHDAMQEMTISRSSDSLFFSREAFLQQPLPLQRRILRQMTLEIRRELTNIGYEALERLLHSILHAERICITLPFAKIGSVEWVVDTERLGCRYVPYVAEPISWQVEVPTEGIITLPCNAGLIETRILYTTEEFLEVLSEQNSACEYWLLPLEDLALPLLARSWKAGDTMRPRGMQGTKKLQDIFTDKKVSQNTRRNHAVLVESKDFKRIVLVTGIRASEMAIPIADLREIEKPYLLLAWSRTPPE